MLPWNAHPIILQMSLSACIASLELNTAFLKPSHTFGRTSQLAPQNYNALLSPLMAYCHTRISTLKTFLIKTTSSTGQVSTDAMRCRITHPQHMLKQKKSQVFKCASA